jgi:hypothetical protein
LSEEDRAAGVVLDAIVEMGQGRSGQDRPSHPLRLVIVKTTPHQGRGQERGHDSDGFLRLLTNWDAGLAACLIALIYRYRGTIEKNQAGCVSSACLYLLAA